MTKLYGLPNCDSCRTARRWLEERGIDFQFVDIRATPPQVARLNDWLAAAGWETLINRRSRTWREIPAGERETLDDRTAAELISRYVTLMKRPVLEHNGQILVGFDTERYSTHIV